MERHTNDLGLLNLKGSNWFCDSSSLSYFLLLFLPDIKYIEMSPGKTKYQESWQSSRSPCSTPLTVSSPNRGHLFLRGGNLSYNYDAAGNISGSAQHFSPTGRQSPTCIQVSESISIPQRDHKNFVSYGSNSSLASSPSILQLRRMAQRCSEASMLSTSPGSDTSYILGR